MVDFDTNGDCDDDSAVPLGDIGYTFCKFFTGYGLFDGTVVEIRPGAGKLTDELHSTPERFGPVNGPQSVDDAFINHGAFDGSSHFPLSPMCCV
jgi:hypothetical protein